MKRVCIVVTLVMAAVLSHAGVAEIVIEGNDAMQFNIKEFKVKAGQKVKLTLKHVGKQPVNVMGHNVVILKAGTDAMTFGLQVPANGGTLENGYLPTNQEKEKIFATTEMIGGGEEATIEFTAPAKGQYPFLCTFPGHVGLMRGVMIVE